MNTLTKIFICLVLLLDASQIFALNIEVKFNVKSQFNYLRIVSMQTKSLTGCCSGLRECCSCATSLDTYSTRISINQDQEIPFWASASIEIPNNIIAESASISIKVIGITNDDIETAEIVQEANETALMLNRLRNENHARRNSSTNFLVSLCETVSSAFGCFLGCCANCAETNIESVGYEFGNFDMNSWNDSDIFVITMDEPLEE